MHHDRSPHTLRRLAGTAATALTLALTVSACGGDSGDAEEQASEILESASSQIEELEESASDELEDLESELGDLPTDVPTDLGEVGLNELPENFPGDVPLADADLLSAAGTDSSGWAVVMESDASPDDAFAQAESVLLDNGYQADSPAAANTGVYSNDNWTIALAVTETTGATTLNYGITPK